ncbi:hypothetical protein BV22DRAFT_1025018, partial [Leucogyrophana mollusca]
KLLNLQTYKYHALGDYPNTIRRFGTTDSYTTQTGELQHRRVKRRYPRTAKNHTFVAGVTRQEARERLIERIMRRREALASVNEQEADPPPRQQERIPPTVHYHISQFHATGFDLTEWLGQNRDDLAIVDFIPRLKDHLLARLLGMQYDGDEHDFTDEQRDTVIIKRNKLYEHKVLRVNYTTYDLRREQDSINPRTRADIMVLAHEDETDDNGHPYWYARVIKILHVMARHTGDASASESEDHQMDVLFVRWFGRDTRTRTGFASKRLPRIGFLQGDTSEAFGFLDPDQVIRGAHVIPAFAYGQTDEVLSPSLARQESEFDKDWWYYYVNIFVDRDMFMRYRGGGIGHKATRHWDAMLQRDDQVPASAGGDVNNRVNSTHAIDDDDEHQEGGSDEENEFEGQTDEEGSDGPGEDDEYEEDPDRMVAQDGEELDDDVLDEEGYGML